MTEARLRGMIVVLMLSLGSLLTVWYGFLSASSLPFWIPLLFLLPPIALAIPGMWQAKRKTYKWFSMAVLLYWAHGLMEWVSNPEQRLYAALELIVALALYWLCIYYVRWSDAARAAAHNE